MEKGDRRGLKPTEDETLVISGGLWAKRIGYSTQGETNLQSLLKEIHDVTNPYCQAFYAEAEAHIKEKADEKVGFWGKKRRARWESYITLGRCKHTLDFSGTPTNVILDKYTLNLPHGGGFPWSEKFYLVFEQNQLLRVIWHWSLPLQNDPTIKLDKNQGLGKYFKDFCEPHCEPHFDKIEVITHHSELSLGVYPGMLTSSSFMIRNKDGILKDEKIEGGWFSYYPDGDYFIRPLTDKDRAIAEKYKLDTSLTLNVPTYISILKTTLGLIPAESRSLKRA